MREGQGVSDLDGAGFDFGGAAAASLQALCSCSSVASRPHCHYKCNTLDFIKQPCVCDAMKI